MCVAFDPGEGERWAESGPKRKQGGESSRISRADSNWAELPTVSQ
jgi:hypothetical protein